MKASLYPEEVYCVWAAHALQVPVRWSATRSEDFLSATHGRGIAMTGALAVGADGRFAALSAEIAAPLGHWLPNSALIPGWNAARILPAGYNVDVIDITSGAWCENRAPTGIYRGAGRPEAAALTERLVDKAARKIGLDPFEIKHRPGNPAVRRDGRVEGCRRRLERRRGDQSAVLGPPGGQPSQRRRERHRGEVEQRRELTAGPHHRTCGAGRHPHHPAGAARGHHHRGRRRLGRQITTRRLWLRVRRHVQHDAGELDAGDAIDGGVVHLGQQADVPTGEPLDDVHLPQRSSPVERTCVQPRDDLGQSTVIARGRCRRVPDVELEIEVVVDTPVRMVEPERHLFEHLIELGDPPDALAEVVEHLREAEPVRQRAAVKDRERRDMQRCRRPFKGQKTVVESRQLSHAPPPHIEPTP
jgi:hypothetical protein